jgi:hypothetical protein
MGKSTTALIAAVVQTNLRAMQELLRAENPKAVLELQQRFACEYMAILMRGTAALVDAIESAAAGEPLPFPHANRPSDTASRQGQARHRSTGP